MMGDDLPRTETMPEVRLSAMGFSGQGLAGQCGRPPANSSKSTLSPCRTPHRRSRSSSTRRWHTSSGSVIRRQCRGARGGTVILQGKEQSGGCQYNRKQCSPCPTSHSASSKKGTRIAPEPEQKSNGDCDEVHNSPCFFLKAYSLNRIVDASQKPQNHGQAALVAFPRQIATEPKARTHSP